MDTKEIELVAALVATTNRIAAALEAIAAVQAPAPNLRYKLSQFKSFDWEGIGATVRASDRDGVSEVEYMGRTWKRRAPSNNFGSAIWFSAPFGKKTDGTVDYKRLVTFADSTPVKRVAEETREAVSGSGGNGRQGTPAKATVSTSPTPEPAGATWNGQIKRLTALGIVPGEAQAIFGMSKALAPGNADKAFQIWCARFAQARADGDANEQAVFLADAALESARRQAKAAPAKASA